MVDGHAGLVAGIARHAVGVGIEGVLDHLVDVLRDGDTAEGHERDACGDGPHPRQSSLIHPVDSFFPRGPCTNRGFITVIHAGTKSSAASILKIIIAIRSCAASA